MRNRIAVASMLLGILAAVCPVRAQGNLTTGRNYGPLVQPAGGTANAQTVTPVPPWASLTENFVCWIPTATNTTTTPTLAVSGLTATVMTKNGTAALSAGDVKIGQFQCATYDGTEFQLWFPATTTSGSGTVSSGTANDATCYNSTGTTVAACPNLTDTSGGNTVTGKALEAKFLVSNQGTAQTSGNFTLTGWGTSPAVGTISGYDNYEQFTITAGSSGTPSNNPTIAVVFPDTFPVTPICDLKQSGSGTGVISDVYVSTAATTTGVTFTWVGTPTVSQTYTFKLSCN